MASKKTNPRQVVPGTPFHVELYRLRRDTRQESAIAQQAGVTVTVYRAIELGQVPCSRAVYDTVTSPANFPQLKKFPRPGPDPTVLNVTVHAAVSHEYARVQPFIDLCRQLNIGTTNRKVVRTMLMLAINGDVNAADVARIF